MDRYAQKLQEIINAILDQMESSGYQESTQHFYTILFHRLIRLAENRGDIYYNEDLGQTFINDQSHVIPENTERYYHERTVAYIRCIKFIESYLKTGEVDWSASLPCRTFPISSAALQDCFNAYNKELESRGLKPNTIDGYRRFTYYFIEYLEGKGYTSLSDVKCGDIVAFISTVCSERYQSTSLGAHMPGLKIFISMFVETKSYLYEIPEHLPQKERYSQSIQ